MFIKESIQVLILTKNEDPNIRRVLDKLSDFEKVLILDSFSDDQTIAIAGQYKNVEIHQRKFDTHAGQWNYGLSLTNSEWILSLDSDYVLNVDFIKETENFIQQNQQKFSAFECNFDFLVFGKKLRRNNTTPRPVLFKRKKCCYFDDGHTQRLLIDGETGKYRNKIQHDDRKSLSRWLANQDSYAVKESNKLYDNLNRSNIEKIRRTKVFAPFFVFFYCLFIQGLILDGWVGWYYTLQRTLVEILFALRLTEKKIQE